VSKELESYLSFFDIKTKIVSNKGVINFHKLKIGDKVLTYNIKTRKIELQKVKNIFSKNYSGEMVNIKGQLVDQKISPKHNILVRFENGSEEYVLAEDISGYLKSKRSSGVSLVCPYPDYYYDHKSGLKLSALNLERYTGNDGPNCFSNMEIFSFIYLIANYLKSGSISLFNDNEGVPVRKAKFFMGETLDRDKGQLLNIMESNSIYHYFSDNCIFTDDKELIDVLSLFGEQETSKKIPKFIWKSSDHLLSLLKEIIFNYEEEVHIFSKYLLKDLIFLTQRLGYGCKFKKRPINEEIKEYIFKFLDKNKNRFYKGHIKKIDYTGLVWGVEIEENKNLLICRNGKVSFSGI
jgi:hypothetical protein